MRKFAGDSMQIKVCQVTTLVEYPMADAVSESIVLARALIVARQVSSFIVKELRVDHKGILSHLTNVIRIQWVLDPNLQIKQLSNRYVVNNEFELRLAWPRIPLLISLQSARRWQYIVVLVLFLLHDPIDDCTTLEVLATAIFGTLPSRKASAGISKQKNQHNYQAVSTSPLPILCQTMWKTEVAAPAARAGILLICAYLKERP